MAPGPVTSALRSPWLSTLLVVAGLSLAPVAAYQVNRLVQEEIQHRRLAQAETARLRLDHLLDALASRAREAAGPSEIPQDANARFLMAADALRRMAPQALAQGLLYVRAPAPLGQAGNLVVRSVAPGGAASAPELLGTPLPEAYRSTLADSTGTALMMRAPEKGEPPTLAVLAARYGPDGSALEGAAIFQLRADVLLALTAGPETAPRLVPGNAPTPPGTLLLPTERLGQGWRLAFAPAQDGGWLIQLPWLAALGTAALGLLGAVLLRRKREDLNLAIRFARSATQVAEFNQARLLEFIELSADWLWETDPNHRFTLVSGGIRNTARLDPADYLGNPPWEVPHENAGPAFWAAYRTRLERREPINLTVSRINLEGKVRHLEITGTPCFEDERFLGYRGIGRDITDRLNAEQALRESEARFRDLAELSSDWYWEQDAQFRYTALTSNPQAHRPAPQAEMLGRTRWEVHGATATDPIWANHVATLTAHQPFNNFVYQSTWVDGEPIWFSVSGRPLFDPHGEFIGYRGVSRDITEERMARFALQESEARYRNTFDHAPVGIANMSPGGLWTGVNDTLCEILGYGRKDLMGQPATAFTHPEDQAEDIRAYQMLSDGKLSTFSREKRFIGRDGSLVWARVTLSALQDHYGTTRGLICVVEDITDRIAALHALRASEERYRRLVDLAPDGVFVQRDGVIQFANRACLDIFGAQTEMDLMGRRLMDLVEPEYRDAELDRLTRLTSGEDGPGQLPPRHLRIRRLTGGSVEVESSLAALEVDQRPAVLCILRNISDRIAASHALQDSQRRYREVVESVNEVIFQTDPAGRFVFLNQAWTTVAGFRPEDSLGRSLVEFLHPDDRARARAKLQEVLGGGKPAAHCELRLRTRDGQIRWIEGAFRLMTGAGGERAGLTGSLDDISSRKIAELTLRNLNQELEARVRLRTAELENSNRELEAFSYSVSHDLRAPLRAIDGFAHIIEEDYAERLDPAGRAYLVRIRTASHRMAALIDDLIELARLTRQPLRREYVDVTEMAEQIVDELRAENPDRMVDLHLTQGLSAHADRPLLRVVLENLLRNAWKFTIKTPHPQVTVSAERINDKLTYCVADNGVGFDMAFADKLFRPFHRLHGSGDFSGSGIGLATVQRVIQRHGGHVWAEARPNEGARFYFTLG
ncbi:MAG: PAS domain S-box protein [Rhodocyclaceae bacterium]|jgi:PAS domain S-box-containing protein|nr:PAS domain S-box protein [Rhodocyclaceae bacterium]